MLLKARQLNKRYLRGRRPIKDRTPVAALQDVSLDLRRKATLVIVGRSGAGKSTLARCLCRAELPDSGTVFLNDVDLAQLHGTPLAAARRRIQLVFQQSATAISPRLNALTVIAEPLRIQGGFRRTEQHKSALEMMDRVGLPRAWSGRFSSELSGGQRQRLALARALICRPDVLLLDEGLAGLDAGTQAQIIGLLLSLQDEFALSYIFITHDLTLAAKLSGDVAVMHQGKIIETGSSANWLRTFTHPESLRLIRSMPEQAFSRQAHGGHSS